MHAAAAARPENPPQQVWHAGDVLADRRKHLGWSQTQLAHRAGISTRSVATLESLARVPDSRQGIFRHAVTALWNGKLPMQVPPGFRAAVLAAFGESIDPELVPHLSREQLVAHTIAPATSSIDDATGSAVNAIRDAVLVTAAIITEQQQRGELDAEQMRTVLRHRLDAMGATLDDVAFQILEQVLAQAANAAPHQSTHHEDA